MNTQPVPTTPSGLVKKSNKLINAMFDLTLQCNRLLAYAISKLPPDLTPTPGVPVRVEIVVLEFARMFGLDEDGAYREVEETGDLLREKGIQLDANETQCGLRVKTKVVQRQDYDDKNGRTWLQFDEEIVPHLLALQADFTQYKIKDVYQFSTASAWRVYELLKEAKGKGHAQRDFEVEELKAKLGLSGLYARVGNFKQRVLDPAVAEINKHSDIEVQYEQRKRGRCIIGFTFLIFDNMKNKTVQERIRAQAEKLDSDVDHAPELSKLLRETYHVRTKQARQIANMAAGQGRVEDVTVRLPGIQARFDALEDSKRTTSLGGYVFCSLLKELTPKQKDLPL